MLVPSGNLSDEVDEVRNIVVMPDAWGWYSTSVGIFWMQPRLSIEKNLGCLGYIGDFTTKLCGDYNEPFQGSLLNNQDSMESSLVFFLWLNC